MSRTLEVRAAVLPLKLSADRKVSPRSRWERGNARWKPMVHNSIGLPPIVTCPDHTDTCAAACYVVRIPWPSAHALLAHNLEQLQRAETVVGMTDLLDAAVCDYRRQHERHAPDTAPWFRVHWSGDYWSPTYAESWGNVMSAHADIEFWSYSRTFRPWALELGQLRNHHMYVSADADNYAAAYAAADRWKLPVATMDHEYPDRVAGRRRAVPCPVDRGGRPMVTDDGVGACVDCGLCIGSGRDIWFPTR